MSGKSQEKKKESESSPEVDASIKSKTKHKQSNDDWNPVVNAEILKRLVLVSFCVLISLFIYFLLGKHLMINLICLQIVGIYWEMTLNRVFKKQKMNLILN
jgi:hypothetical protein